MTSKIETRNSKLAEPAHVHGGSVKDFRDLAAWQLGRQLRVKIYDVSRKFPGEEKYVLLAQLRRAAISVTANVAEGFGRFSYRENIQYCRQARGSAYEIRDHLTTALDAGYIAQEEWVEIDALTQRVAQVLNGYIRATQKRQSNADTR